MKTLLAISIFCLVTINTSAQLITKIDTAEYRLTKSFFQNGCKLNFWEGSTTKTKYTVLFERKFKTERNIFSMEPAINGEYSLTDKNHDGFLDFLTNYHGYDIVYLFNSVHNRFDQNPVYIPEVSGLIDKKEKIYWSYRETQYSDHMSFSTLYQFHGNKLLTWYKIVYVTKEDYDDNVIRLDLYRMKGEEATFVKTIKTKHPKKFQCKYYWKRNYLKLLSHR